MQGKIVFIGPCGEGKKTTIKKHFETMFFSDQIKNCLPEDVSKICSIIEDSGEAAYVVGGCIRDTLINHIPNDWDITTSAAPEKIVSIFGNTFGNGINYGIPFIRYNNETYEIAQFRKDVETDGRHCKTEVALSINEDLERRDFTINAIAYRPKTDELEYPQYAMEDISNHLIRCVGDANARFKEDELRILRMYRFASVLGFDIESKTRCAAVQIAKETKLAKISGERIHKEFTKLICGRDAEKVLRMMKRDGVLEIIIPEMVATFDFEQKNRHHCYDVFEHIIHTVSNIDNDAIYRWSALLHDIGKPHTVEYDEEHDSYHFPHHPIVSVELSDGILRRLAFSNEEREYIQLLIKYHDLNIESMSMARRYAGKFGIQFLRDLYKIRLADVMAQSDFMKEEKVNELVQLSLMTDRVEEENSCLKLKDLAINGKDVLKLGFKGPEIGKILNFLLDAVIDNPALNEKNTLLSLIFNFNV